MSKNFSNYASMAAVLFASLVLTACSTNNKLAMLNDDVMAAGGLVSVAKTQRANVEQVKKLVIPAFNVTYLLKADGKTVSVSEDGLNKITSHVKVNVENANVEMLQTLTNKAYNIFVGELKRAKIEVVALDSVAKSESYFQVNEKDLVTSVSIDDDSITLVPEGLKLYDPDAKMDPEGSFLMGVANINSAINGDLVAEFGGINKEVAAMSVNLTVRFGNFDLEDHRVNSEIAFNPSFTVIADGSKMEMQTKFKTVSMPGRVFYIPEESAAYSLRQDMGSRTNVISGMLDVSSEEGVEEYNATINEAAFERAGIAQIERVSRLFVEAMTEKK